MLPIKKEISMGKRISLCLVLVAFALPSMAGKVEEAQKVVKDTCAKDIDKDTAVRLVKELFLSCSPGSKVDVQGCSVPCQKSTSGAVIGQ